MKNYFTGKVIWITGASSGIGEAIAMRLSKQEARLILSSNEKEELEKVALNCQTFGATCHTIIFDLSVPEQVNDAAQKALSVYGKIDMLFNIAGLSQRSKVTETPVEIDRKIMEVNFFSAVILTKAVLPSMLQQGGGQIVAVSSIAGKFGFPLRSAYSAAKHAIYGFFETLNAELKQKNIHATIACPGRVQTSISFRALTSDGQPHGRLDKGQASGITADKCACKLLKAVEKKKREVLIGGNELIMVHLKKWLPFIFYRIVSKIKPT